MTLRIVALGQDATDRGKLRAIVTKVAIDGYAVLKEEFVPGGSATAAPVPGSDGTIVAAVNVGNGFSAVFRRQIADHRRRR